MLRETDTRLGLMASLARCFRDYRNLKGLEHPFRSLVAQRVYSLALIYEDLTNREELRCDSLLAFWVGKRDLSGAGRFRRRNRGCPP